MVSLVAFTSSRGRRRNNGLGSRGGSRHRPWMTVKLMTSGKADVEHNLQQF
jgi:hypothetical protein